MLKLPFEIRNDDILLYGGLTGSMVNSIRKKTFEDWFYQVDEWFEERQIPMVLAVLADGIDEYPQWVEYIKKRMNRFTIDLHGHSHINYKNLSKEQATPLIRDAIKQIEDVFETKITRWYFPFNWRGLPSWGEELCGELGIGFNLKDHPTRQHYFHYWNTRSVRNIKKIIEKHGIKC